MKILLYFILLTAVLCIPDRLQGKASEPSYILQNRLSEAVAVEFVSPAEKWLGTKTVEPGRELSLRTSRRIIVRTATRTHEYALPAVLDVPISGRSGAQDYQSMIDGNWRVILNEATTLSIEFIGGGTVERIPDFTKPPLLFPLRPRRGSETFEQYKNDLRARTRSALMK